MWQDASGDEGEIFRGQLEQLEELRDTLVKRLKPLLNGFFNSTRFTPSKDKDNYFFKRFILFGIKMLVFQEWSNTTPEIHLCELYTTEGVKSELGKVCRVDP